MPAGSKNQHLGGLLPQRPPEGLPVVLGALAGQPPLLPSLPPRARMLRELIMSDSSLRRAYVSANLDRP